MFAGDARASSTCGQKLPKNDKAHELIRLQKGEVIPNEISLQMMSKFLFSCK
jgi:hypothetical protein